jgi:hypothetical protein
VTPIQPGQNDLRGQQITPGRSGRTTGTGALVDQQKQALGKFTGFKPFVGVDATDTSGADRLAGAAERAIGTGLIPYNMASDLGATGPTGSAFSYRPAASVGRARGYGTYDTVRAGTHAPAADTSATRGAISSRLGELQGPDRGSLAARAFKLMQEQNDPVYAQRERALGQKAAALGRVGSGVTNSEFADLATQRTKEESLAQRQLAMEAAAQELADRRSVLDATQGVYGQLSGQDLADAGFQQGLRNEARSERGFGFDVDQARNQVDLQNANLAMGENQFGLDVARTGAEFSDRATARNADNAFRRAGMLRAAGESDRDYGMQRGRFLSDEAGRAFDRGRSMRSEARDERGAGLDYEQADLAARRGVFGDLSSQEDRELGYERSDRNELRGERGYQDDLANQALENDIRRQQTEQNFAESDYGMYDRYLNSLGGIGNQYDPTGQLTGYAQSEQDQADQAFGGLGDLAAEYFYRHQLGRSGQAPPAAATIRRPTAPDYTTVGSSFGRASTQRPTSIDRYRFGG